MTIVPIPPSPNTITPEVFHAPLDRAQFHRVSSRPGVDLYKANIVHHAFEPHTHQVFGLGAIASGVERIRYGDSDHLAPPNSLVLMNPDELHTGRGETTGGWRYRMLYIDPAVLAELAAGHGGRQHRLDRLGPPDLGLCPALWHHSSALQESAWPEISQPRGS